MQSETVVNQSLSQHGEVLLVCILAIGHRNQVLLFQSEICLGNLASSAWVDRWLIVLNLLQKRQNLIFRHVNAGCVANQILIGAFLRI